MSIASGTNLAITSEAAQLTSVAITPANYRTRAAVSYTFYFIATNNLIENGHIEITIPTSMTVTSANLALTVSQTVASSATLEYQLGNSTIKIVNAFTSAVTAPVVV